jgi:hypothetical protein
MMDEPNLGEHAFAQMIHSTHLFTWLVQTAGKAMAILIVVPVLVGIIGAFLGESGGGFAFGSLLGVVSMVIWMTGVSAPLPSSEVIALLEPADE